MFKRKFFSTGSLVLALILSACGTSRPVITGTEPSQSMREDVERKIDELISQMTLEEKLGQLTQFPWDFATGPTGTAPAEAQERQRELVKQGRVGSFLNVFGADYTRQLQRIAVEDSRLRIPLLFGMDVIHGYRTIFPVPLAEASSWDPVAVENAARIAATEAASTGIHWTFAPMLDIARDPRWGRIVEGSGEDAYLGSVMAAARVHGFQGNDLSLPNTILACAKHFAAYGAAEGGRDYNTVELSRRTLRKVYLPPYHAAVQAGVATFMSAFNELDGIPATANRMLQTDILRSEWKFNGMVVSDWNSIGELLTHGVAGSRADAGELAIEAGVDMDMVSGIYTDLLSKVQSGAVAISVIDTAVRRILRVKHWLGLFEDPYRYSDSGREAASILNQANIEAARDMARKSIVLLKNEGNLLPLDKKTGKIAVIGPLGDDNNAPLGSWAAQGRPEDVVTLLQGLRSVNPATNYTYARGSEFEGIDQTGFNQAIEAAQGADVVLLVLGERADWSGEAASRASIELPEIQQQLAERIISTGKPIVLVLMNGRPLALGDLAEKVPAILETWFLGLQAGPAIADVLFGDYTPGGKLTATFPRKTGQIPIYYNHQNTGRPPDANNKYTSKYLDLDSTPLFPFGHGLSYTTFEYSNLLLSGKTYRANDTLEVSVNVENTGGRVGSEVVQLYVRDVVASSTPAIKELKGFMRIDVEPHELDAVHFRIPINMLGVYDDAMRYVVEPGQFELFIGSSSEDIRLTDTFQVEGTVTRVPDVVYYSMGKSH